MGEAGIVYGSVDELAAQLRRVLAEPSIITEYRSRAMARVMKLYNWEQITDQYELLLARLAGFEEIAPAPLLARQVEVGDIDPLTSPFAAFAESEVAEVRQAAKTARTLP